LIIDKISENDISLDDVYKNYVLEGGENKWRQSLVER
jgi:hypothetical protein